MSNPEQLTVSPEVAVEEALLRAEALEAFYRNRNLYLAQTVVNQKAQIEKLTKEPVKKG